MMDLRTRLLLAIGGGVLLIVVIIVSVMLGGKDTPPSEEVVSPEPTTIPDTVAVPTDTIDDVAAPVIQVPIVAVPTPVTAEEKQALYVRQVARDFTERFLSFSNKNDNKHLADIESLVTVTMWDWAKNQKADASQELLSQTTKVVSTKVTSMEAEKASVQIGAQQSIQTSAETKTVYKRGRIELVQINGAWKVDGLFWE